MTRKIPILVKQKQNAYLRYPVVSIYQPMGANHQTCDGQDFIQLPNHTHVQRANIQST
jgi:hypothetical protein